VETRRPQDLDAYRGYKYPASATKRGCAFKAEAHGPAYEKGTSGGAAMIDASIRLLLLSTAEQ